MYQNNNVVDKDTAYNQLVKKGMLQDTKVVLSTEELSLNDAFEAAKEKMDQHIEQREAVSVTHRF